MMSKKQIGDGPNVVMTVLFGFGAAVCAVVFHLWTRLSLDALLGKSVSRDFPKLCESASVVKLLRGTISAITLFVHMTVFIP